MAQGNAFNESSRTPPVGAGAAPADAAIPAALRRLAGDGNLRPVWRNELGGLTFALPDGTGGRFVKWSPREAGIDLADEYARLAWARTYVSVPEPVALGQDESGTWLVTRALPGETAVSARWRAEPAVAVLAIGRGLRRFHDALPVATCPFSWSAEERVADAQRRARAGLIDPRRWHPQHQQLDLEEALAAVERIPPGDALVVCHGDACAPNTLLDEAGRPTGHVDLGRLGVADRWADLAVAAWSTEWNYGPGWQDQLIAAYGVRPDQERMRYYRLLWDLGP